MTIARPASVGIALLLLAGTAKADTTSSARAEILFQEGRNLFTEGKYAEACERFSRSEQLDPAVGTLLNLGDCYKRIKKTASAWTAYREAERLANERKDDRRAGVARNEVKQLETMLARIQIELGGTTPGLAVTLNGEPVDPTTFISPVPIDPGDETVAATAPGRKPWSTAVEIPAGTTKTVTIPKLESNTPSGNPLATGLEIGGGVGLAVALVFGGLALSKWSDIEAACPNKKCPTEEARQTQQSALDSARPFAHISTITAGLGLAALSVGLYLDFFRSKRVALGIDGQNVALRVQLP